MEAKLIIHDLTKLNHYQKVLFNREVYGYIDNSNNNSYQYERIGMLSQIPHFRLLKSAIVIKKEDISKMKSIFNKHHVKYEVYTIFIEKSKLRKA